MKPGVTLEQIARARDWGDEQLVMQLAQQYIKEHPEIMAQNTGQEGVYDINSGLFVPGNGGGLIT